MKQVEIHQIKRGERHFDEIDDLCFKSKNLFNSALYTVRQHFFETGKYLNFYSVDKIFKESNQPDYRGLPIKVSQQTLKGLDIAFSSFFALHKKFKEGKYPNKPSIPHYKDKVDGRFTVTYTNQCFSKPLLRKAIIQPSGTNLQIVTKCIPETINQVKLVKVNRNIAKIIVIYTIPDPKPKEDNKRYASIDLGVNNLATVSSNVIKPYIINGRPIKSVNQFFNKTLANLQSKGMGVCQHKKDTLSCWRNNHINDYLHKASRYIVNHLVSNNINTLIIGYNKGWKQDANIGRVNNQKFVQIPHLKFVEMLEYKCRLVGITVIRQQEAYTSKCSFMDNEPIKKHTEYVGKRIKRGLFKTRNRKFINADLNGSLNILKKAVGEFQYPIEVCSTPCVITLK